jgi:hypothetical protein
MTWFGRAVFSQRSGSFLGFSLNPFCGAQSPSSARRGKFILTKLNTLSLYVRINFFNFIFFSSFFRSEKFWRATANFVVYLHFPPSNSTFKSQNGTFEITHHVATTLAAIRRKASFTIQNLNFGLKHLLDNKCIVCRSSLRMQTLCIVFLGRFIYSLISGIRVQNAQCTASKVANI